MKRKGECSRGQTLVEFALVLPIIVLLMITVIDFARGLYYYNTVANSARAGARFAVVLLDDGWQSYYGVSNPVDLDGNHEGTYTSTRPYIDTKTIVGRVAQTGAALDPDQTTVKVEAPQGWANIPGLPVAVSVAHPFTPLVSFIVGGLTINLQASSVMTIE